MSENKTALYNIASTVLIAGINFITIPIFTRLLDTNGYGVVNVYTAWVQMFSMFVGLKLDGSIGSAVANIPDDEQDSYLASVLTMSFISFLAVLTISLLFYAPLSKLLSIEGSLLLCVVIQSFGAFLISFFSTWLIFKKRANLNFLISVGLCLATTILSIVLIRLTFAGENGYLGRVYGLTIPNILIGVGLLICFGVRSKGSMNQYLNKRYWTFCLALSLPLIFHGLSQNILAQTGKIAVQRYYDDSLAGVYSLAVTIVSLLNAIYGSLNNAFVPFMYDDLAGKTNEEKKISHFRNYFVSFTLGTCAFALISPEILKLMSSDSYWGAIDILPPLIVGQYCVFLYSFPVNYEFFRMSTKSVAIGTLLAAIANVALVIVLVPRMGMMGAALATMLAYVGLFLFHYFIARYMLDDRNYPVLYYFAGLAAVLVVCFIYYPLAEHYILRGCVALVALACIVVRISKTRSIF